MHLGKKCITDHDFPPPNLFVGSENKKYGKGEVRTHDLLARKQKKFKHQPGFEARTYNLTEPPLLK